MRKRSKYRPKGVRIDAMDYVLSSIKPLASLGSEVATLRIRNHGALAAVCQGKATRDDVDVIIAALNVAEALVLMGVGTDYAGEIRAAQDALKAMAERGVSLGDRFIFRATELQAINHAMDIHDAQLDTITVQQLERAVMYVGGVIRAGKARAICAVEPA